MDRRVRAVTALVPLLGLLVSCSSDEEGTPSCLLTATIAFAGRGYIAVDTLPGLARRQVRVGARVGTGERATCAGRPVKKVRVFKVRGVPVERAVYSTPEFGLMERWNRDGSIK